MPELMWVLLALAVVVTVGLGLWLSRGGGGDVPDLVDDRPQPRIPAGAFTAADVRRLRFARVPQGYQPRPVDELLRRVAETLDAGASSDESPAAGAEAPPAWDESPASGDEPGGLAGELAGTRFAVVRGGYQMGQVDAVLDRLAYQWRTTQVPADGRRDTLPGPDEPPGAAHASVNAE